MVPKIGIATKEKLFMERIEEAIAYAEKELPGSEKEIRKLIKHFPIFSDKTATGGTVIVHKDPGETRIGEYAIPFDDVMGAPIQTLAQMIIIAARMIKNEPDEVDGSWTISGSPIMTYIAAAGDDFSSLPAIP
ncbi:MAG: hypothetical protein PHP35_00275 [Candidatus Colwellbacteria bacterium]|nr:hypothetical protein [Candidatus Colwellbacteria bacterium]